MSDIRDADSVKESKKENWIAIIGAVVLAAIIMYASFWQVTNKDIPRLLLYFAGELETKELSTLIGNGRKWGRFYCLLCAGFAAVFPFPQRVLPEKAACPLFSINHTPMNCRK